MQEQEQNSEIEEVATQELGQDESNIEAKEIEQVETVKKADDKQERNWRAMEQRQREMEWEIQKRDQMLEMYKPKQEAVVEEPDVPDDEYVPAGRVKRITERKLQPLEKKLQDLEAKIASQEQQKQVQSLRVKFSDFDDVVNMETLEILEKNEPELAATISGLKDPYKMGIQSYKYIKALSLADSVPDERRKKEIDKKIEKNAKSVQSPMAYEKRPIAQAMKTTKEDADRIYRDMMYWAGQASGL